MPEIIETDIVNLEACDAAFVRFMELLQENNPELFERARRYQPGTVQNMFRTAFYLGFQAAEKTYE